MLFGTRERFEYFQCAACGTVQIARIPDDLGRFYPKNYFSFKKLDWFARNPLRRFVDPLRVRSAFGIPNFVGRVTNRLSKPLDYIDWVKRAGLTQHARVLDVGCGAGKSLICMAMGGFTRCEGLDPFIESTLAYDIGVTVIKMDLGAFAKERGGSFDFVMSHHSFEHVVDPLETLKDLAALLSPGGRIMLDMPVVAEAWDIYRENWCNLDPPRHLHILTVQAVRLLANQVGLDLLDWFSHGRWYQFTNSELYKRDIPANANAKAPDHFSAAEIVAFKQKAEALNREGRGDIATFYLTQKLPVVA